MALKYRLYSICLCKPFADLHYTQNYMANAHKFTAFVDLKISLTLAVYLDGKMAHDL